MVFLEDIIQPIKYVGHSWKISAQVLKKMLTVRTSKGLDHEIRGFLVFAFNLSILFETLAMSI